MSQQVSSLINNYRIAHFSVQSNLNLVFHHFKGALGMMLTDGNIGQFDPPFPDNHPINQILASLVSPNPNIASLAHRTSVLQFKSALLIELNVSDLRLTSRLQPHEIVVGGSGDSDLFLAMGSVTVLWGDHPGPHQLSRHELGVTPDSAAPNGTALMNLALEGVVSEVFSLL